MTEETWKPDAVRDLADLCEVSRRYVELANSLDDEGWNRTAADVSSWGVGQHLEHVAFTHRGLSLFVVRLLKGRPDPKAQPAEPFAVASLASGNWPRGQFQVPGAGIPPKPLTPDEVRAGLAGLADKAEQWSADPAALAAAEGMYEHPYAKGMTANEWVRFLTVHGRHHLAIIDEIVAATSAA